MSISILEISENEDPQSLTELRKKFWLQEFKIDLQIEKEFSKELKKEAFKAIILNEKSAASLVKSETSFKTEVRQAEFADSFVLSEGKWWLQAFLLEALSQLIVKKAPALNTHRMVYVTGNNFYTRMSAVAAIRLGLEHISFVTDDPEQLQEMVVSLQKNFFDLQVLLVKDTEITLQTSNASLLINTVSAQESPSLIEDLTYLNFLEKQNSLFIDLPFSKESNEAVKEAEEVGISCLHSTEVWGMRDFLLLEKLQFPELPEAQQYLEKWQAFLTSI